MSVHDEPPDQNRAKRFVALVIFCVMIAFITGARLPAAHPSLQLLNGVMFAFSALCVMSVIYDRMKP